MLSSFYSIRALPKRILRKKRRLMFHHLAKNAGSSIRHVLQQNYSSEELFEFYEEPEIQPQFRDPVSWFRNMYVSLPDERKRALKCFSGHSIHYLLPTLDELENRPCRVFCILRHPVDRMVSLYHFIQRSAPESSQGGIIAQIIRENNWSLEDIYLSLGGGNENTSKTHFLFREFFNGQARAILLPHMPTEDLPFVEGVAKIPRPYRDKLNSILDKHYTLGAQEEYNSSVRYFGREFGWKRLIYEKVNTNESRPALDAIPPELARLVQSYNAWDVELHQAAIENLKKYAKRFLR